MSEVSKQNKQTKHTHTHKANKQMQECAAAAAAAAAAAESHTHVPAQQQTHTHTEPPVKASSPGDHETSLVKPCQNTKISQAVAQLVPVEWL